MKLFVFDCETGGLDPAEHSLLTLGGYVWEDGQTVDSFHIDIAEEEIVATTEALEINGIDVVKHSQTGYTPLEAARRLEDFLRPHFGREKVTLAGQNTQFDYGFLKRLYSLAGAEAATTITGSYIRGWEEPMKRLDRVFSYRLLDTQCCALFLEIAGLETFPNGRSLGALCEKYGVKNEGAHNALHDAKATAQVLTGLLGSLPRYWFINREQAAEIGDAIRTEDS